MSVSIFTPTPYINKWQMSLCNNSSDNKSYWIHRVDVKIYAQVTTVTYMHQSQPSLHLLRIHFTVHLELWPGNHLIWCNATSSHSARSATFALNVAQYACNPTDDKLSAEKIAVTCFCAFVLESIWRTLLMPAQADILNEENLIQTVDLWVIWLQI